MKEKPTYRITTILSDDESEDVVTFEPDDAEWHTQNGLLCTYRAYAKEKKRKASTRGTLPTKTKRKDLEATRCDRRYARQYVSEETEKLWAWPSLSEDHRAAFNKLATERMNAEGDDTGDVPKEDLEACLEGSLRGAMTSLSRFCNRVGLRNPILKDNYDDGDDFYHLPQYYAKAILTLIKRDRDAESEGFEEDE